MSNEIRIGALALKFLVDDAQSNGSLVVFEMSVPEKAKVPAPHYHKDFEEAVYGLAGTLTMTVDGKTHELKPGDALFVPRGVVHHFDNAHVGDARVIVVLTPAIAARNTSRNWPRSLMPRGHPTWQKSRRRCCVMAWCQSRRIDE